MAGYVAMLRVIAEIALCERASAAVFWKSQRDLFRKARGFVVGRLATAIVILISSLAFATVPARAQQNAPERMCFPWQEFRDGACVATSGAAPAPSVQCSGGTADTEGRCVCPANTHLDAGACVADVSPSPSRQLTTTIRESVETIACDGGTATSGICSCPAEFRLLPAASGKGGVCVRTNAENCLGGDLTATGSCLCTGRVTMSGEAYALELLGGKCVPKRCPVDTYLKAGQCVASNDRILRFTCRTGYIPEEANPGSPATGLHCIPDPTFCPADSKQKSGSCAKLSAIAIDCFEDRCICGPNADWVGYLCQCVEPYRNVNGSCVAAGAATASHTPTANPESEKPELQSAEPPRRRKACGRGMVRTAAGNCFAARQRYTGPRVVIEPYYPRYRYRTY
jgi:hypothetical protein